MGAERRRLMASRLVPQAVARSQLAAPVCRRVIGVGGAFDLDDRDVRNG
jgi:hypothetical protein